MPDPRFFGFTVHVRALDVDRRIRWTALVVLAIWAIVAGYLLVRSVPLRMPRAGLLGGGDDFDAYRDGIQHVLAHQPLYAEPLIHQHLYTYPPFSTLVFFPFTWLPFGADTNIWLAVNFAILVAIVVLCWRTLGYRVTAPVLGGSLLLAVVCAFLEPVRSTLLHGQINLLVMLLVLWDTSRGEHSRLKGIGVGIAAGIKLTPAYFVLYYLALRQWRAAAVAVATTAATVALGFAVLPADSRQYWAGTLFDDNRIADDINHPSNQSLRGTIARLIGGHPETAIGPLPGEPPPTWLWLVAAAAVVAVSMWVAVRCYRADERLLAVTVAGLTAAVVSPFSWTHHWVWVLAVLVYAVHRALTNRWWWLCAAAVFVVFGSWPYRFPGDLEPRIGLFMFPDGWVRWELLSNLFIVLYAVLLAGAAVIASRRETVSALDAGDQ